MPDLDYLDFIQKISEDEELKASVRRLVIRLNDSVPFLDVRFSRSLPQMLGYKDSEQYAKDVLALLLYVGSTLVLENETDDFERTETGRIKGEYTPDGKFEPD